MPTRRRTPPTRILVLANKPSGIAPNQRYRFEQWAPRLKRDHDIELDLVPFESPQLTEVLYSRGHHARKALLVARDFRRRSQVLLRAHRYDAVLVVREAALIGPAIYERLIAWSGTPIIFDFDDAIWAPGPDINNGVFTHLHFFGKTSTICRIAAACTVGNAYLASYARQRNPRTVIVPTSIELDDYPLIPEPGSVEPFVVCWTGSASTLAHFEHAREALEKVALQIPLAVKIICSEPPKVPIAGAQMRFVRWTAENEAQEVGDSNVGIMPLPDNEFTRGKCGLKALQYMATGRPAVVSPVGVNTEIVRHGENGFLASTTDDFVGALLQLAASEPLRRRLGAAGRKTVEESFSAEVAAAKFAEVVRSVTR
jgi:glycosyltransferase involved in cell wall biosynthesis